VSLPRLRTALTSAELSAGLRYELVWHRPPSGMPALISVNLRRCAEVTAADFLRRSPDLSVAPATGEPLDERIVQAVQATIDEADRVPDREAKDHARDVCRLVQGELDWLGGPGTRLAERDRDHANRLGRALYQALETLRIVTGSRSCAKAIQIETAPVGVPLSICRGHSLRRIPAVCLAVPGWREKHGDDDDVASSGGDGCLRIIEDSRAPLKPRIYCDSCNRKGPGLERRALALVKNAWKGNVVTNTGERSVLCKCGKRFRTDKEKVQRCPHCEKKHA
jgi:hypothetical protein